MTQNFNTWTLTHQFYLIIFPSLFVRTVPVSHAEVAAFVAENIKPLFHDKRLENLKKVKLTKIAGITVFLVPDELLCP